MRDAAIFENELIRAVSFPLKLPENAVGEPQTASDRSRLADQIGTVREMVVTLDTLSVAGQHYIMRKVIAFTQAQVKRLRWSLSARNQHLCSELVDLLIHACELMLPDRLQFAHRAATLLDVLATLP
jgi:hypothetical protein